VAKRLPIPGYLTYADVAEALACHASTVKRLWHRGILPAPVEVEGLGPRFLEDEIAAYIARTRTAPRMVPPRARPPK
jgi:excisionase family DNA binding protein